MTKKERIKKILIKLIIFGFILIFFNLAQISIYGRNAEMYSSGAAMLFIVVQTCLLIDFVVVIMLFRAYLKEPKK